MYLIFFLFRTTYVKLQLMYKKMRSITKYHKYIIGQRRERNTPRKKNLRNSRQGKMQRQDTPLIVSRKYRCQICRSFITQRLCLGLSGSFLGGRIKGVRGCSSFCRWTGGCPPRRPGRSHSCRWPGSPCALPRTPSSACRNLKYKYKYLFYSNAVLWISFILI